MKRIDGPDILRAFAIICVIACHTGIFNTTAGGVGNKIFFVMAGFLSAMSLSKKDKKPFSFKDTGRYYKKKILRIIPSYETVLAAAFFLVPGFFVFKDLQADNNIILNMFFLKGYGHLWFMQQMILMYLLAPFIVFFCDRLLIWLSGKTGFSIASVTVSALLFLLAICEKYFLTEDIFALSGAGSHRQFQLWMFLAGMSAFYLAGGLKERIVIHPVIPDILLLLVLLLLTLSAVIPDGSRYIKFISLFQGEWIRTVFAALLMLMFSIGGDKGTGFIKKLTDLRPVKLISAMSYDMYLIHFFLINIFSFTGAGLCFIIVFMLSLGTATVLKKCYNMII